MSAGSFDATNCTSSQTLANETGGPLNGSRPKRYEYETAPDAQRAAVNRQHNLTRSKWVFRAYLDARAVGEDDEAAELFELWLRLLGRSAEP